MVARGTRASSEMSEDERNGPSLSDEAERRREAQRRRLAEALRENLQKRKQQSRGRAEPAG
jgi:hypothetical protein